MAAANKSLGRFHLDGIAPARRGVPQIEVTFDIDANGIVNVSAKDLGTGKQKQITITARSKLSEDEIEQAIRDAQAFAGEDTSRKRHWDVLNDAQNAALGAEQYLNQNKKTLSREDKRNIKGEIAAMQKLIRGKKPEKMSDQEADYIEAQAGRLKAMTGQNSEN